MGNVLLGFTGMSWKVSKLKNNIYKMRGSNIKNVYLINEKKLFREYDNQLVKLILCRYFVSKQSFTV